MLGVDPAQEPTPSPTFSVAFSTVPYFHVATTLNVFWGIATPLKTTASGVPQSCACCPLEALASQPPALPSQKLLARVLPFPAASSSLLPPTPTPHNSAHVSPPLRSCPPTRWRVCLLPPLFSLGNSSIPFSLSRALICLLTSLSPLGHFRSCHRGSALFISASRGWHKEILPFVLPLLLNKWHCFRNVIKPINYLLGHIL